MNNFLIALIAFNGLNLALAEDIALPAGGISSALQEGIQRELSAAQIAELLPWAKDSKIFLADLIDQVNGLPMEQKIERLTLGIKQVVIESAPKQSELIMRYSLNRALLIVEALDQEMSSDVAGSADAKLRVITASINFSLKYFDQDIESLSKKTALPFADFGKDYFNFLHELNKSIFDASAQYKVERIALELLQWDLYRDLNNTTYASQIVKINNALKLYPNRKISDKEAILTIKQMKKLVEQLNIVTINKNQNDKNNNSTKVPVLTKRSGTFRADYYGKCRAVDAAGSMITSQEMPAEYCASSFRADYYGKCRAADSEGSLVTTEIFAASKCASTYRADYYGKCRAVDTVGSFITTEIFAAESCAASYRADYYGKCRAVDNAGAFVTTEEFSAMKCAAR